MKKTWMILGLILSVSIAFLFLGCGQSTETATTTTTTTTLPAGMTLNGIAENLSAGAGGLFVLGISSTIEGNPNYPYDVLLTPESYAVGIWKFEILTGEADPNPYVVKNFAATTEAPIHFPLSATATTMATNPDYPEGGTYTVCRPTLAYLEMVLAASDVSFEGLTKFRLYTSTVVGDGAEDGDVKVDDSGTWKWIDEDTGSLEATRPAHPVQDEWFYLDESPDPFAPLDTPMDPVVMPASPTGEYTATLTFDVSDTFFFDDVDGDGVFEPSTDDIMTEVASGEPAWFPGPPVITMTVTTET
ncbi:MAG: hypothetical protein V3T21_01265 [Candidatus Margulisiibacteriota bacterium]